MVIRTTHTLAELELSPAAYEEIANKLLAAGWDHAFLCEDGMIDMSGVGITRLKPISNWRCVHCKLVISYRGEPPQCPECSCHTFAKCDVMPGAPRVCTVCHKAEGDPHPYRHIPNYEEVV